MAREQRDCRVVLAKKMAKREVAAGWREPSGLAGARLVASARGLEKTGRRAGGGGGACGIGRLSSYRGGRWPARVAGAVSISREEGRPEQSRAVAVAVAADAKWWSSRLVLVVLLAGAWPGGQTRDERGPPARLGHRRHYSTAVGQANFTPCPKSTQGAPVDYQGVPSVASECRRSALVGSP